MLLTKEARIVAQLRQELFAEATCAEFRAQAGDFSRQPVLTLPRVATLIVRGHQMSQQNALNKFFRQLGRLDELPTSAAYCQARHKLRPELFVQLNEVTVREFSALSQADGSLRTWHGHRLLGADGSKLNLPDTKKVRAAFSVVTNQHGPGSACVQGLAVVVYDLLHDLGLAAHLGALAHEPDVLMQQLWHATQPDDVLVLDRIGADYALIAWAAHSGRHLIVRCPQQSFGVVNDFWAADEAERLLTLPCSTKRATQQFVRQHGLPEQVPVRLLKFTLPSGEQEVLLTTLCDQARYPRAEFYEVYGWRWRQETYYDRLKNIFEVERFSGFTPHTIQQDFYGVLFLATLESTLAQSAQAALAARAQQRGTKIIPQVNRAVSYVSLLDETVALLADPTQPLEQVLARLQQLLQTNPKRHPPGRKFARPPRSPARSLRHQRYRKRVMA